MALLGFSVFRPMAGSELGAVGLPRSPAHPRWCPDNFGCRPRGLTGVEVSRAPVPLPVSIPGGVGQREGKASGKPRPRQHPPGTQPRKEVFFPQKADGGCCFSADPGASPAAGCRLCINGASGTCGSGELRGHPAPPKITPVATGRGTGRGRSSGEAERGGQGASEGQRRGTEVWEERTGLGRSGQR